MKKIKLFIFCIILIILLLLSLISCGKPKKESIRIGAARSITGPLAIFEKIAFGPIYKMWIDEVNADGGIYIKKYGKKLPIETIIYDDKSDVDTMTELLEKLIVEDKVDLILPPAGTAMLFSAAPVANNYKYLLMGAEGGASKLKEIISGLPYFYSLLNFSDHYQLPVLADLFEKKGVKKAAIIYLSDVHGVEWNEVSMPLFKSKGINIAVSNSVPIGVKDLLPLLKKAKAANVDAICCYAYPDEIILAVKQSMEIGFNPKVFVCGPGGNFEFFSLMFGQAAEGIVGFGAWNRKVSPEHKELADKLEKLYGRDVLDWWGHNVYYAGLQFLQQAIEKAGTLDQEKIREIYANEKFNTILGPTWFDENHLLAVECYAGQVGQWQNGIFEVIGPDDKATAEMIYPKPKWP